jgi:hypothetical protein
MLITLTGKSGKKYKYSCHPVGTEFKSVGGNYAFVNFLGYDYKVIYIGKTNDLGECSNNHYEMPKIKRAGATHICIHPNSSETSRTKEESDLIANYEPPCNKKQNKCKPAF